MKTSMRFDLVDLRLFLFVVEAASITHGAGRAGMALASASERIRLMEESLGAPLLERHRRGVRATPAGTALVHHAQLIGQQLERMREELSEYADGFRGRIRLLANTTAVAEFLPAALAAFLTQHPLIDIDLEERSSRDIVRAVAGNLAEIGIVGDVVNPAKELQTFPFAEDRLVLIAPRGHAVTRQRAIGFRDTLSYDHVGLPAGNALQDQMDDHATRAGRRLKLRVRLPGFDAVCQVVGSGVGVAVVPGTAARRYQRSAAIRIIPLTDTWAPRRLTICVRSFVGLPPHGERLVEHLRAGHRPDR
jgi:DNA-binding transcriptional LysR family regulator